MLRRSISAAAAHFHDDEIAGNDRVGFGLVEPRALSRRFCDRHPTARRSLAALNAPWRTMLAVEVDPQIAGFEHAVNLADAKPAAKRAGAAGILPQRHLLDAERIQRFLQLDRDDARIAVRHGAERSGAVVVAARAPSTPAAVDAIERRAIGALTHETQRRELPKMAAGDALRQRPLEGADEGVDHERKTAIVVAHRRGRIGAEQRAGR